jgi:predicted RNase H-like HicB family nuclease
VRKKPLSYYLNLRYPFVIQVDKRDGYFVTFPDLPGCMTGADRLEDLPAMIREGSSLWLETEYASGDPMPEPTYMSDDDYSGKFNVRLPKSLHRDLAETADASGVSLNQLVVSLLSAGDALARIERRLDALVEAANTLPERVPAGTRVAEERGAYTARPAKTRATSKKVSKKRTRKS